MFYGADLLGWNGNGEAQEKCPTAPGLGVYPVTPHPWWILIEDADEPDWSRMLSKASSQKLLPCETNASNIPLQFYLLQQELNCPIFHGLSKRTNPSSCVMAPSALGFLGTHFKFNLCWDLPRIPFPEAFASSHCHVETGPAHVGAWNQVSSNPNYPRILNFWDDYFASSPFLFLQEKKAKSNSA